MYGSARTSFTILTCSSSSGYVSVTHASCHWLCLKESSLISTISSILRSWWGLVHLWHYWRDFLQREQNSFIKCWTRRHRFLEYLSASLKLPGRGNMILNLVVSKWFGVRGTGKSGSSKPSTAVVCYWQWLLLRTWMWWGIYHRVGFHCCSVALQGCCGHFWFTIPKRRPCGWRRACSS